MHADVILIVLFFRRKEPKESVFLNALLLLSCQLEINTFCPPPGFPYARPEKESGRMPTPWLVDYDC